MEPAHLVGTGGAIGAVLRYLVAQVLPSDRFPFATLAVNVLGSFLLGVITFAGARTDLLLFVGVGICGSFTTYSSFSVESIRLWETGSQFRAVLYAGGTFFACVFAVGAGWLLAGVLF